VFETFIGIARGSVENGVAIGILDVPSKKVISRSFPISKAHLDEYYIEYEKDKFRFQLTDDLVAINNFLDANIRGPRKTRLSMEAPGLYPYPSGSHKPTSVLWTEINSIHLKLLVFLQVKSYVTSILTLDDTRSHVLFRPLPPDPKYAHLTSLQPRYLGQFVPKAYGDFLLGSCDTAEKAALIAALIAKNNGGYYYWSSYGRVQSSQDVAYDLRLDYKGPTSVFSAGEKYILVRHENTRHDDLDKIHLEYALASKRYEFLEKNNVIKAALLHICKKWNITLKCISDREDADEEDKKNYSNIGENAEKAPVVYPLAQEDEWIIHSINPVTDKGSF